MAELDRDRLRRELAPEGSLRDILIPSSVGPIRAQRLWERLRQPDVAPSFRVGGDTKDPPQHISDVFALADIGNLTVLRFVFERLRVDCFFWIDEDIEMTIDPTEIIGDHGLQSVIDLLRLIGEAVGLAVQLTEENGPDEIILRYDPAEGRLYQPPSRSPEPGAYSAPSAFASSALSSTAASPPAGGFWK